MALEDILRRNEAERRDGIKRRFVCPPRNPGGPPPPVNGHEYPGAAVVSALLRGEVPGARPDTYDADIWRAVVRDNEYNLPDEMHGWTVLDCGAHIGGFAHACLARGAAKVVSVEADPANFEILWANVAHHGDRVVPLRSAIWRADEPQAMLKSSGYDGSNTGAGICLPDPAGNIPALPLDALIAGLFASGRQVDLLKLDIEGAEWPVLHTAKRLGQVRRIVGEWHDWLAPTFQEHSPVAGVRYTLGSLLAVLEREGFELSLTPTATGDGQGHFFAQRKEPVLAPTPPPPLVPVQKEGPRTATRATVAASIRPTPKTTVRATATRTVPAPPQKKCCGQK